MPSSILKAAILAIAAGVIAPSAFANDTSAELATGGLIFVRNDSVEMRSEELTISPEQVIVRYRFFNKTNGDVTVLVAFPMPEIKISGPDENISIPTEDPVNILGFTTVVDGRPVKAQVQQRVFAAGLDRTGAPFSEERIEYVLKTGANWAGPIRDFRLIVDKGDANSLVSFCGQGVKRVSPTRFEMRATDFVPQQDLSILILKRLPKQ